MAGQIIESSFDRNYPNVLSHDVAEAFGRAQGIQANLQAEQARNALTQQQIGIQQAAQQTNAQLTQAEIASQQTRNDLMQKLLPSQLQKSQADADLATTMSRSAPGRLLSEQQAAQDAHLIAQGNIAMQGVDQKKADIALQFAVPQIQQSMLLQAKQADQLSAHTQYLQTQNRLQLEQQKNDDVAKTLQLIEAGYVTPDGLAKAKALNPGSLLDHVSPDMIGNPKRMVDSALAHAAENPESPQGKAAINYLLTKSLGDSGIQPDKQNPLAGMVGKDGKPLVSGGAGPNETLVNNLATAFGQIQQRRAQATSTTQPTGAGSSVSVEETTPTTFDYKPTGVEGVDSSLAMSKQNPRLASTSMSQLTPIQREKAKNFIPASVGKDLSLSFGTQTDKELVKGYSPAETASIKSVMQADPSATVQQNATYATLVKGLLQRYDLNEAKGLLGAQSELEKSKAYLSKGQQEKLQGLLEDFKQ